MAVIRSREFATLEWVDWFNNRRLLEPIGNIPPAEAKERYYAMLEPWRRDSNQMPSDEPRAVQSLALDASEGNGPLHNAPIWTTEPMTARDAALARFRICELYQVVAIGCPVVPSRQDAQLISSYEFLYISDLLRAPNQQPLPMLNRPYELRRFK
jgi:hypothetical protein